jgi:hypothetical protein
MEAALGREQPIDLLGDSIGDSIGGVITRAWPERLLTGIADLRTDSPLLRDSAAIRPLAMALLEP